MWILYFLNETKRNVLLVLILLFVSCTPVDDGGGVTSGSSLPATPQLTLTFPDSSNADSDTIEISASSVSIGNTIKLYSDSNCSVEVSSIMATSSSVVLTFSTLDLGIHKFFVSQETPARKKSPCSEVPLIYVYENQAPDYNLTTTSPQPAAGTSSTVEITISGVTYGHTIKLCADATCSEVIGTIVADSDSVVFSTPLTELGDYTFYAQTINSFGESEIVEVHSYSYGAAPSAPTFASSSGIGGDATPDITVSGVSSGDVVKIFSDNSCSTEMGSATSTGASVDVTSSELSGFITHSFYANSTNVFGTSDCSETSTSYELLDLFPAISYTLLPSKRLSFVDCGVNQQGLQNKIFHCSQLNDGAIVEYSEQKTWKLVTKIGSAELWLDENAGVVWGPDQGVMNWSAGMSRCSGLSGYGISGESWFMPHNDYYNGGITAAEANGVRYILSGHSSNRFWSSMDGSYVGNSSWAWSYTWDSYYPYTYSKTYTFSVRCVFNAID